MKTNKFYIYLIGTVSLLAAGCSTTETDKIANVQNASYTLPSNDIELQEYVATKRQTLPKHTRSVFSNEFEALRFNNIEQDKIKYETYRVKKGDSAYKIARQFGVEMNSLLSLNGLNQKSILQIGQELQIPNTKVAAPKIIANNTPKSSPKKSKISPVSPGELYMVKPGDILGSIAKAHNTSVSAIKSANSLRSDKIFVGQKLRIPSAKATQIQSKTQIVTTPRPTSVNTTIPAIDSDGLYTIKYGDSVEKISSKLGINASELRDINGLDLQSKLQVGKKLLIPNKSITTEPANSISPEPSTSQHIPVVNQGEISAPVAPAEQAPTSQDAFFDTFDEIPVIEL